MPKFLFRCYTLYLLLLLAGGGKAQKHTILISNDLAAGAEKLPVKMGTQWLGKIWHFRFGEYAVVSSKAGWSVTTTTGNFWNTKTESNTTSKFSFVLSGGPAGSAQVNTVENIRVDSLHELQLSPHFSWGSDELVHRTSNFSAFITLNNDTSETWALFMNLTTNRDKPDAYEGFMTNGERKILLVPASSNKKGEKNHAWPALGYELMENDQALGALQYYGGGMMGMNKNMVWINKSLDAKLKLVLAAAITAVLQVKQMPPGN